jgi:2-methylisocitrate lyase-like PEP mutase family enzyme
MDETTRNDQARALRALHDGVLVLANVWDAASARVVEQAGASAVATGSAGIAWSMGRPDGQQLTRAEMVQAVARIAAVVTVPVTADMEGGYDDVRATVTEIIEAGAVGMNLEDSQKPGGGLADRDTQAGRIRAAREAATAAGVPDFVINARTDVHLFQVGAPADRPAEVLSRAKAYAEAGADCLFVPGLLDLDALRELTAASPLPVNALAMPGGPDVAQLAAAGVHRISLGANVMLAAYAATRQAVTRLLSTGGYDGFPDLSGIRRIINAG